MDLARDDSFAEAQLYALVDVAAAAAGAHRLDDVLELAAERSLAAIGGASRPSAAGRRASSSRSSTW